MNVKTLLNWLIMMLFLILIILMSLPLALVIRDFGEPKNSYSNHLQDTKVLRSE
jgi:hypothetical protein